MKQTTVEEKSAGGVVFRRKRKTEVRSQILDSSEIEFLIGKHSGYHKWVLPKGLVERGESAPEAAVREVGEEVGVEARIIDLPAQAGLAPLKTIEYYYYADPDFSGKTTRRVKKYQEEGGNQIRVHKKVVFYLMEWQKDGCPPKADQPWAEEMEERRWVRYEEGMKLLAFDTEREVFGVAGKVLECL